MSVQSPVALKDSVGRLRLFKKRNATIAAIGTIRPISERSMIGGSFGSSRFGKNCERLLKEPSSNEAMGPSGTVESSHACERGWLALARKLDWNYSYVREEGVFPEVISGCTGSFIQNGRTGKIL